MFFNTNKNPLILKQKTQELIKCRIKVDLVQRNISYTGSWTIHSHFHFNLPCLEVDHKKIYIQESICISNPHENLHTYHPSVPINLITRTWLLRNIGSGQGNPAWYILKKKRSRNFLNTADGREEKILKNKTIH